MSEENKFYVYIYLDPRKIGNYVYGEYKFEYEPFYVGKGHGYRLTNHLAPSSLEVGNKNSRNNYKVNKINKMLREGFEPIIIKFVEQLTEVEAHELEIEMIKIIGRSNLKLGPLTNLTDGGEGVSGYKPTPETIEKIRQKKIGFKMTPESRKRCTKAVTERWKNTSEDQKKEIYEKISNNWKLKMEDLRKRGEKRYTEEHRRKIGEYSKINGHFKGDRNPSKHRSMRGKDNATSKFTYFIYECRDGNLIHIDESVFNITQKFEEMTQLNVNRYSYTSHFYKGYYIIRYLHDEVDKVKNKIDDIKLLEKMKDYDLRYRISQILGKNKAEVAYNMYKIFKDDKLIFESINCNDIISKFDKSFMNKFKSIKQGIQSKYKDYILQKIKLTEDFLNG